MRARPGVIPETHDSCEGEDACVSCKAERHLTTMDWEVVGMYRHLSDQVVMLGDGGDLVPRLEGWLAAFELHSIAPADRPRLVDDCRYILNLITGRQTIPGVHSLPIEELEPLQVNDGG